ncbi:MAG: Rpp14/Pop5 family protein [Methanoregula sp.]
MSVRPPTLREKRRYLLAWVEPFDIAIDGKDLYYAIYDAASSLWGDVVTAAMRPAVMSVENGYVILRCRRGMEREFSIALSTVSLYRENAIALRVGATSGTIESLRDRIKSWENPAKSAPVPGIRDCTYDTVSYEIVHGDGQKVDVIEKGFKNAHRLFLTNDDLEEKINATTISDGI